MRLTPEVLVSIANALASAFARLHLLWDYRQRRQDKPYLHWGLGLATIAIPMSGHAAIPPTTPRGCNPPTHEHLAAGHRGTGDLPTPASHLCLPLIRPSSLA